MVLVLATVAKVLAAVTAVLVARRREEHRPIAWFLTLVAVTDLPEIVLVVLGVATRLPDAPFTGLARLGLHVRQALYLTWPFGFMATCIAVFLRRNPWPLGILYGIAVAAFALSYPEIRGADMAKAYLAIEIGCLLVGFGVLVQWAWRRRSPSLTHITAIILLFGEAAVLFGPWRRDVFATWDMARIMYLVIYMSLALLQGGYAWKQSTSS
jgi:hypothetical protein